METFDYFFGNYLATLVLRHADILSSTLQHESMSAAEGQQVAKMTVATLKSIRNDESYDGFWKSVTLKATHFAVSEPKLPRRRKIPKRYDSGSHSGDYHTTPESYYKQLYFEAFDLIINGIEISLDFVFIN